MPAPRAHHYLPVFYLRGFIDVTILARKNKEVLWVYEKGKPVRQSTPNNEAHERDFYSHEEGSIEQDLSRIEGAVAPIFARTGDAGCVLNDEERAEVAFFIGLMFSRVPAARKLLDKLTGEAMKRLTMEQAGDVTQFERTFSEFSKKYSTTLSAQELREFILKGEFEIDQESRGFNLGMMLKNAMQLGGVLFMMNWQILHAPATQLFLTADNPVISVLPDGGPSAWMGVGLARPGVEVYFPVSARVCLRLSHAVDELVGGLPPVVVRQVNRSMMFCAHRFAFASVRSTKLKNLFDKVGCQLSYGENAFVPAWKTEMPGPKLT